ncbi:hypothetical protein [Streptomyces sp. NPDC101150]|uniref:hypothetical protein n=1 Tax=Streptomyces sp. NPDC101150 TaxID=3366114 RepID=UPI00383009A9
MTTPTSEEFIVAAREMAAPLAQLEEIEKRIAGYQAVIDEYTELIKLEQANLASARGAVEEKARVVAERLPADSKTTTASPN